MPSRDVTERARVLSALFRSEMARADSQAGTVLAAGLIAFSLVYAAGPPALLAAAALWWLGMMAAGAGCALLGYVSHPSIPRREQRSAHAAHNPWDVLAAHSAGTLVAALGNEDEDGTLRQLVTLAGIAAGKFARVRVAFACLGTGLVFLTASGLVAALRS